MIKPIMQTKFVLPFIAAGAMILGGCYKTADKKLHDYMADKGYRQTELNDILKSTQDEKITCQSALRQSALDSIAYGDLFNSTSLAEDSAAVAEFNKIAGKASLYNALNFESNPEHNSIEIHGKRGFLATVAAEGKTISETEEAGKFFKKRVEYISVEGASCQAQAASDEYFYGDFFEKKGLFKDTAFSRQFKEASKFLRK